MDCCKTSSYCCCGKSFEQIELEKCPVCETDGILVKIFTVKHIVLEDYLPIVGNDDFYLCTNPDCNVGYYNNKKIIYKEHLKVPIWLKKDANPKYACYCNKVTFDDILDVVLHKDAKTLQDVLKMTGAMSKCECNVYNPTGNCCYDVVKEAFEKALEMKNNLQ